MSKQRQELDLRPEIGRVAADFESVAGALRDGGASRSRDAGITHANLSLLLPYHLIEGFPFRGDLEAARVMSRANAFGAAHFLAQDRVLDGAEDPTPARCELSDVCMGHFIRGYAELFPADSGFWSMFDRYIEEYFLSLRWEREVLWGDGGIDAVGGDALSATLRMLGRKISPLKATVAGIALLSGSPGLVEAGERIVEAFHAGYQLEDDLSDLADDAAAGRWSSALRLVALGAGVRELPAGLEAEAILRLAVATGAHRRIAELTSAQYSAALALAQGLELRSLASYLHRLIDASARFHAWAGRRTTILLAAGDEQGTGIAPASLSTLALGETDGVRAGPALHAAPFATPADLHRFSVADRSFLIDGSSGLFFEADDVARDVLACLRGGSPEAGLDVVRMDHGNEAVDAALGEIALLASFAPPLESGRGFGTSGACRPGIVSLALNVTSGCNLSCDYCYLNSDEPGAPASMDEETALRAIEFLIEESSGEEEISLVFFGGEPLLESGLILATASRARERAREVGCRLTLHLTTNGTLLTRDVAAVLRDLNVNVLISIDGSSGQHDRHRKFRNGAGSYERVASNLSCLPGGMNVSARVTVTPGSERLVDTVSHLRALGFRTVHLAAVSGAELSAEFERWLLAELGELAAWELEAARGGVPPSVGNFTRVLLALGAGRPRSLACGAGARYLCVAPDGTLYLCHRFAGRSTFAVGDVRRGVNGTAIERKLSELRRETRVCDRCWARSLCGGPCLHDLDIAGPGAFPDASRCSVTKRTLELSMWLYASLPEDVRRHLGRGTDGRPT